MDCVTIIIPARNETLVAKTVESVLAAAVEQIEIIVVLDGYWPDPAIRDHPSVNVIHYTEAIGQRAAINQAARIARGKYIMKLDAHCCVAGGFDKVLKEDCRYEWTMVPRMYNLDVVTWKPKKRIRTDYMYISSPWYEKPFRAMYYGNYGGVRFPQPKNDKMIDETMCCMGPGWFMHKDRFWELDGCDEAHGGWGQQGVEVSLKAWLSGGALMVNKRTWFAHWFRGGGVPEGFKSGFPYSISGRAVERARSYSRKFWVEGKWPKATRNLEWLVKKFNPPTWEGVTFRQGKPVAQQIRRYERDISVIIPSYKDPILHKTVKSILDNFKTNYEIIVVLDGYKPQTPVITHPRISVIELENNVGMREAINIGVRHAKGKYIMRSDEHCMFCPGFDEIILKDIRDNEIVDAVRYFLDPIKWERMDRKPIIYEKLILKHMPLNCIKFASVEWPSRARGREGKSVDEKMCFQGSVWVMARSWWDRVIKELQTEGYGPLYQDTIEMLFKTWKAGGRLVVNKKAWYAHRHRNFGRVHSYPYARAVPGWHYSLLKHWNDYQSLRAKWQV